MSTVGVSWQALPEQGLLRHPTVLPVRQEPGSPVRARQVPEQPGQVQPEPGSRVLAPWCPTGPVQLARVPALAWLPPVALPEQGLRWFASRTCNRPRPPVSLR